MKNAPLFFALFAFSLAAIGCQSTPPPTTPKAAVVTPSVKSPSVALSPRSLYNDAVQNSPLARYMRGEMPDPPIQITPGEPTERRQVEMLCVSTGDFNIAPDGQSLQMETWCGERNPVASIVVAHVPDTIAPRVPGKMVFRILFQDAVVTVEDLKGGGQEVKLHYRDANSAFHHIILPPRADEVYRYSFAKLSPDTVIPIGEPRVLEVGLNQ